MTTVAASGVLAAPSRKRVAGRKQTFYGSALERLCEEAPEARSTVRTGAHVSGVPAVAGFKQVPFEWLSVSPGQC
ncbi:hypothetical protein PR003_g23562 [Phytophthora rubi]|nr:hypothetical protein PR002_g22903 [Phytophthora rubi]KAE9297183.1 hypothetical protein PR003_g23562 [Phytophthora rubi]